ncbi:hypothetical protein ITR00_07295 [Pediococcus pentosaceus]|uniref:hypothetical protein n=1 Tax=Pediococcus pentosaceus TaxID=1255 RepID=UPI00190DED7A|nr:hypothetical protein [Pediococcus pentosaceus]MBF7125839.1 hypothetical protein [Pediococcus pentosaceus]WPK15844.1 hypothetical protein R6U75_05250 [Pediococcus pentosaceus]
MIVIINEDYQVKVDNYANYTLLKAVRDESGAIKTGKHNFTYVRYKRLLFQHEPCSECLYSSNVGR